MLVEKIREEMQKKGVKQKDLVEMLEVNQGTLAKWLSLKEDNRRDIPNTILVKIADILSVDVHDLLGLENNKTNVKKVPIIGTSSCGGADINHLQIDGEQCLFGADSWNDKIFCVIANGDSMAPEIEDGDQVICDPTIKPQHGDLAYYKHNGESAIKVFVENKDAGVIMLKPINANEHFKTTSFRIDDEEIENVEFAKVVGINKMNFNNKTARLKLVGEL